MQDRPIAPAGWWRRRALSFRYAFRGVAVCLRTQTNARVHAVATVLAIGASCFLALATWEWCIILGAIAVVWTAETFNTALELIVDFISPEHHPLAGRIKDVAAAAVLMAASGAFVIGAIILAPKLWALVAHSGRLG